MATKEDREAEIARHKDSISVLTERLRELGAVDDTTSPDLTSKHKREDEGASLFERSTPAERLELYHSNREAWQRMMDAHEQAGLRKLFGSSR